jgi:hypothetical protein
MACPQYRKTSWSFRIGTSKTSMHILNTKERVVIFVVTQPFTLYAIHANRF